MPKKVVVIFYIYCVNGKVATGMPNTFLLKNEIKPLTSCLFGTFLGVICVEQLSVSMCNDARRSPKWKF